MPSKMCCIQLLTSRHSPTGTYLPLSLCIVNSFMLGNECLRIQTVVCTYCLFHRQSLPHFQRLLRAWFTLYTVSHIVLKKTLLNLPTEMKSCICCWLDKQLLGTAWKMEYFQSHEVIVKNNWPLRVNTVLLFLEITTHWREPILELVMPLNIRRWFLLHYLFAQNMCWK